VVGDEDSSRERSRAMKLDEARQIRQGRRFGFSRGSIATPILGFMLLGIGALSSGGCGSDPTDEDGGSDGSGSSFELPDSAWIPDISGGSSANHDDSGMGVTEATHAAVTAHVIPLNGVGSASAESDGVSSLATVTFTVTESLGTSGSLSLVAQAVNTSEVSGVSSSARVVPILLSLTDPGGKEYVKLSSQCTTQGLYSCTSGGSCSLNSACAPQAGSAFMGDSASERRSQWEQHQDLTSGADVSSIIFPSCRWTGTGNLVGSGLGCPFDPADSNSFFTSGGVLRTGTYTATYALLSNLIDTTASTGNGALEYRAALELTTYIKKDSDQNSSGYRGTVDLNVILVGSQNVTDAASSAGQRNLNALFQIVNDQLAQTNSEIRLGTVRAYDWDDSLDGDLWASVDLEDTPDLFALGSQGVDQATEGSAINIFLVSTIPYSSGGTILGRAGGIPGAPLNGTLESGLVFSSFDYLAAYNPLCSGLTVCPTASQDSEFIDMGATITHELGHFLGLNHPSESDGTVHDAVLDTPGCTNKNAQGVLSTQSCYSDTATHPTNASPVRCSVACSSYNAATSTFCPTVEECQFNHVMWWTSKNVKDGGAGDGNLISPHSGDIINFSPFIR
jgi:hypothetical protein